MPILGAHMSTAGGYFNAVTKGAEIGCDCIQIFTKNNKRWVGKPLTQSDIDQFQGELQKRNLPSDRTLSHVSYLINLANPKDDGLAQSRTAMTDEIERAAALGIPHVVVHPGSYTSSTEQQGIDTIIASLDEVLSRTSQSEVCVLLETTAGQGTNLGWKFEHLAEMIERCQNGKRLGVCVDTCHIFAAGYPLSPEPLYEQTVQDMEKSFGLKRIKAIHLNDSKQPFGSRKDRHQHIGIGQMGEQPFRLLLNDPRFSKIPMYLETEKGTRDGEDMDAMNLRVLRSFVK